MGRLAERATTSTARRWAAAAVAGGVAVATLTGCQVSAPRTPTATQTPSPTPTAPPVASPTPSASAEPVLDPTGTAEQNLAVFAATIEQVWATGDRGSGREYVDALAAQGFDKSAMELTPDTTTVGNAAESIQISVLWGADCLIGQVGPAVGDPVAVVLPALAEGRCLVGATRPIDW